MELHLHRLPVFGSASKGVSLINSPDVWYLHRPLRPLGSPSLGVAYWNLTDERDLFSQTGDQDGKKRRRGEVQL